MTELGGLMGEGDPSPITVPGRPPSVLAVHGFGATPLDVELVCAAARARGLRAHAPLLPGHGTHCRDLVKTTWDDWARHVEGAFDDLAADGPVIVAGLSLGSLLALHAALRRPDSVQGLALLANALWLAPFPAMSLGVVERLPFGNPWLPKSGADIADPVARKSHLTYDAQPARSAIEVLRAGRRLRAALAGVTCPLFIAHGRRDRVCPIENVDRVVSAVASQKRTVLRLPRSRHIITRDIERAELAGALEAFFRELAGN